MTIGDLFFAGVDIETTGSQYEKHGICQIGIFSPGIEFVNDIFPLGERQAEALAVNKFTEERLNNAPPAAMVDETLVDYFHFIERDRRIISIGWNVGSFDMPFIRKFLPRFHKMLSYRSIDLNAVCFTISPDKWMKVKKAAKKYAEAKLGVSANWHDALYDAKAAFWAWEYLREVVS